MFITTKRYESDMRHIEHQYDRLNDKYWELYHKHDRLLRHLGLYEHENKGIELRSKGGPEPEPRTG